VRYLTPKTRKSKTDLVGGSPDDDPTDVMEEIREEELMERIEAHMEGQTKTKTLQEVMWELGIEVDE
jgi:hypothetical protein